MAETFVSTPPSNRDPLQFRTVVDKIQPTEVSTKEKAAELGKEIVKTGGSLAGKKSVQATVITAGLLTGSALIGSAVAVATLLSSPAFILILLPGLITTGIGLSLLDISVVTQIGKHLSNRAPESTKEVADLSEESDLFSIEDVEDVEDDFPDFEDDFNVISTAAAKIKDGKNDLQEVFPSHLSFDLFDVNEPVEERTTLLDLVDQDKQSLLYREMKIRGAVHFTERV
ncbi:MAG: hypothetical protein SNF33_03445 [Candidatus Algichlamydia australiensis]|nr:hypothetical protein [Chlamydiales bacterium]